MLALAGARAGDAFPCPCPVEDAAGNLYGPAPVARDRAATGWAAFLRRLFGELALPGPGEQLTSAEALRQRGRRLRSAADLADRLAARLACTEAEEVAVAALLARVKAEELAVSHEGADAVAAIPSAAQSGAPGAVAAGRREGGPRTVVGESPVAVPSPGPNTTAMPAVSGGMDKSEQLTKLTKWWLVSAKKQAATTPYDQTFMLAVLASSAEHARCLAREKGYWPTPAWTEEISEYQKKFCDLVLETVVAGALGAAPDDSGDGGSC